MKEEKQLSIKYFGTSDIGLVRTENQDSFGKFPENDLNIYQPKGLLFIIADGMGGHTGGKEASQTAVEVISREYYSFSSDIITNALLYAFKTANLQINRSSGDSPQFRRKGTTCSALVIENELAHIAHVGDSKIYKITDGNIIQFTNDHTEVSEMVRKKILTEEEAKNHPSRSVLARALGIEADVEVDLIENIVINNGDYFVLCTDGLAKVSPDEINQIVLNNTEEAACTKLISLANERGGHDNVTVEVIKIENEKIESTLPTEFPHKKNHNKLYFITALIAIVVILALLGLSFQKEIKNFFSAKSNSAIDTNAVEPNIIEPDNTETLLTEANKYLAENNLDSAMIFYSLILNDNPMHIAALDGKEKVAQGYIRNGEQLIKENNSVGALSNFKKAFALNPENNELANKIITIQKNTQMPVNEEKKNTAKKNKHENQSDNRKTSDTKTNIDNKTSFTSNLSEWNTAGLNESDFKYQNNSFTFLKTNKVKKIIFKQPLEDIDISFQLLFDEQTEKKAGIIVGYHKTENPSGENYYLFFVDNSGNYSFLKFLNGTEETLVFGKTQIDTEKKILNLKIKCLGPWIMLYNDNKLLKSYLSDEFIKGKIGLFSDSNLHVKIDNLLISSAFEKK